MATLFNWPRFKDILSTTPLDYSYLESTTSYYVFTSGTEILGCIITKDGGTDQTDFEATYKALAVNFFYTEINQYQNVAGNATTVIKSGAGLLRAISINNNTTGGTVTVYDNTAASGMKIMTMQIGSPSGGLLSSSGLPGPINLTGLDIRFNTGLTIVTAGSANNNITAYYR